MAASLNVTPNPITDYVALEYAKNKGLGLIITQPDMYPIEELGLIKIDLLSQRSLGVLRDTLNSLNREFLVGNNNIPRGSEITIFSSKNDIKKTE